MDRRSFLASSGAALAASAALSPAAFAKNRGRDTPVRGRDHPMDRPAESHGGPLELGPWRYPGESAATDAMLMFRGNPSHTFYGRGPVPDKPEVRWRHRMIDFESLYYGNPHVWRGTGWTGQAAYLDGYVFIGSQGRSFYAFEAETGTLRWRFAASRQIKASVCVYDNHLYFGSVDDWLRCMDARTGEVVWRLHTGRDLDSSACVTGGKLYIAGENGWARCLEPKTGELIWKTFVGGINRGPRSGSQGSETSPAVVDGEYYTATYDGELFKLDAETGEQLWVAKTHDDTDASPVVSGDYVYTAAEDKAPNVYCFAREDGREIWRFANRRGWWSTPAVADDVLYIGGDCGRLYALDVKTGKERWSVRLGSRTWSSPAVVDGKVIIGSFGGELSCWDAKTGAEVWKLRLGGRIHSTPIIMNGWIYIGSGNGFFHGIA